MNYVKKIAHVFYPIAARVAFYQKGICENGAKGADRFCDINSTCDI